MKKQILFLSFFVLALLAGVTNVFGQGALPSTIAPNALTGCDDGPLHPLPGKSYPYVVSSTSGDTPTSWTWWATKNPNFIDAQAKPDMTNMLTKTAGELLDVGTGYGVVGGGTGTVEITWSPEILAKTEYQGTPGTDPSPTFVAVMANGNCTNNIQVYEINPVVAFTLDITNIAEGSTTAVNYTVDIPQCVDVVRGATYNVTDKALDMDYGKDTLYFEIIAANFVTSWIPTFTIISGLNGDQTAEINWAYTMAQAEAGTFIETSSFTGLGNSDVAQGTVAIAADPTVASTVGGVSIYARVIISNNTHESLTDVPFVLAVDGQDSTGQWDLMVDCTDNDAIDTDDKASQTITARPNVTDGTVDGLPDPDTFIPKTVVTP